jgi:hypothetical protein
VTAYGQPTGPGPVLAGASPKRKSQGGRGTESPDSFGNTVKKTENYVPVFSEELHELIPKVVTGVQFVDGEEQTQQAA